MTRRPSLSGSIVVNGANVVVVVGAALLAVPLLIDRIGLAAYGVWVLAQTVVIYVTTAELGFGPALARFVSIHVEHPDRPRQVLIAALGLYAAAGLVVAALCHLLAGPLVDLFSVPASLHADAVATVGIVGWVTFAALLASALGHVLTGLERFRAFSVTNALGSVAWLLALLVLLDRHARLQTVAYAALLQWSLVSLLRLVSVQRLALGRGPRLPGRALLRDLVRFSARLQLGVLSTLVNTQTDRVVIGAVRPPPRSVRPASRRRSPTPAARSPTPPSTRWPRAWRSRSARRDRRRSMPCWRVSGGCGRSRRSAGSQ